MTRLGLVFDADDTLWETSRLYRDATDRYAAWLADSGVAPDTTLGALHAEQARTLRRHGVGVDAFVLDLQVCAAALLGRRLAAADRQLIDALVAEIRDPRIELYPGVRETLEELALRHDLFVLTRGKHDEQRLKLERSGVEGLFRRTQIVATKTPAVYARVLLEVGIDARCGWMIGNSLRYDIAPALSAGLGAVYLRNDTTWALERGDLPESDLRLITIEEFSELLAYF